MTVMRTNQLKFRCLQAPTLCTPEQFLDVLKKTTVNRSAYVQVKKGLEYALGKVPQDNQNGACFVMEHEDIATRLSQTMLVCP
jgi:hypothetical protein